MSIELSPLKLLKLERGSLKDSFNAKLPILKEEEACFLQKSSKLRAVELRRESCDLKKHLVGGWMTGRALGGEAGASNSVKNGSSCCMNDCMRD